MPLYEYECSSHGRALVSKPMAEASREERCKRCFGEAYDAAFRRGHPHPAQAALHSVPPMRRVYSLLRPIIRPSGYRLHPDDPKFSDFRREMELGELKDDATPVTLSPSELAAWDNPPIAIPPDPARDYQLAQAVRQNWTEDLSPGVQYNRDLAAKRVAEEKAGQ